MSGVLRRSIGTPHSNEGPCHGVAEKRIFPSSGPLRRSEGLRHSVAVLHYDLAIVHSMENCYVLVLFCYSVAPRTRLLD